MVVVVAVLVGVGVGAGAGAGAAGALGGAGAGAGALGGGAGAGAGAANVAIRTTRQAATLFWSIAPSTQNSLCATGQAGCRACNASRAFGFASATFKTGRRQLDPKP